jgi:hypothetical protein
MKPVGNRRRQGMLVPGPEQIAGGGGGHRGRRLAGGGGDAALLRKIDEGPSRIVRREEPGWTAEITSHSRLTVGPSPIQSNQHMHF